MYGMENGQRRLLSLWSRGPDVEFVQRVLLSAGYDTGNVDGIYGPRTMQAVVQFQRDNNLVPDGIVGPNTWAVIDMIYP